MSSSGATRTGQRITIPFGKPMIGPEEKAAGNGRSVNEMLAILRAKLPGIRVRREAKQALMPERGTLSGEKARALIGYQPRHPLEVGFAHYIDWYRDLFETRGYSGAARAAAVAN